MSLYLYTHRHNYIDGYMDIFSISDFPVAFRSSLWDPVGVKFWRFKNKKKQNKTSCSIAKLHRRRQMLSCRLLPLLLQLHPFSHSSSRFRGRSPGGQSADLPSSGGKKSRTKSLTVSKKNTTCLQLKKIVFVSSVCKHSLIFFFNRWKCFLLSHVFLSPWLQPFIAHINSIYIRPRTQTTRDVLLRARSGQSRR